MVVDVGGWFTDTSNPSATGASYRGRSLRRGSVTPGPLQTGVGANQCNGNGTTTGTLGAGGTRTVAVTGAGRGADRGVVAVVANVTVTDTTGASFLTVWPDRHQPAHGLGPQLVGRGDRPQPGGGQARHRRCTGPLQPQRLDRCHRRRWGLLHGVDEDGVSPQDRTVCARSQQIDLHRHLAPLPQIASFARIPEIFGILRTNTARYDAETFVNHPKQSVPVTMNHR